MPQLKGIDQNSDVWIKARIGCVTASKVSDVMEKLQDMTKEGSKRSKYRLDVTIERLIQRAKDNSGVASKPAVIWGINTQPQAMAAYELLMDCYLMPGGLWKHDTIEWFLASPDYLVGDKGLVEIKCPETHTHITTVMTDVIPKQYQWQMHAQMACTGREWVDFVSFDPRVPENLQLYVQRFERDPSMIGAVEIEVEHFLGQVELTVHDLTNRFGTAGCFKPVLMDSIKGK